MILRKLVLFGAVLLAVIMAVTAYAHHRVFKGDAVYYSDSYKGETMACGGKYQPWKMVAAHRNLDCGKRVKVKNLANDKVVKVTIKDRGPYGDKGTIIDVSRKAAKELGFYGKGRTPVKVTVIHDN